MLSMITSAEANATSLFLCAISCVAMFAIEEDIMSCGVAVKRVSQKLINILRELLTHLLNFVVLCCYVNQSLTLHLLLMQPLCYFFFLYFQHNPVLSYLCLCL